MEQFPCAFEFSEKYLLEIHDHVYSCQFGNFIGNSQKEREELKIFENTHSLWPFLLKRKQEFMNPLYISNAYKTLQPNTYPFCFKFWCGMYNRFDKGMHPRQSVLDHLLECMNRKATLKADETDMEDKLPKPNTLPEDACSLIDCFEDIPAVREQSDDLLPEGDNEEVPADFSNSSVANNDLCLKREINEEEHGPSIQNPPHTYSSDNKTPATTE
ncbi:unnamed protein product, partial [Ranitomeya imitator]